MGVDIHGWVEVKIEEWQYAIDFGAMEQLLNTVATGVASDF